MTGSHSYRAILAWTGLAVAFGNAAAVLLPEAGPARLPLTLAFACLGPGCALVTHARVDDAATAWALALVLSLAIVAGASAVMVLAVWWHPAAGALILSVVTAGSCIAALCRSWRRITVAS